MRQRLPAELRSSKLGKRWLRPVGRFRELLRVLCLLAVLLGLAQVIFLTLVLWAAAVPNQAIVAQLRNAYATGQLTPDDEPNTSLGNWVDKYSECSGLSVGLIDAGFPGRLRNVLAADFEPGCGALQRLISGYSTTAGRVPTSHYFRYWHGYNVLDRPLLAWFGLPATRSVVAALLMGALVFLGAVTGKAAGWPAAATLVAPLLLTTDFADLPQSLNHAISMSALLVGAGAVAAVVIRKGPRLDWLASVALLSGAVYCFLDVFLTPPLACGLTVATGALSCYRLLPATGRLRRLALVSLVAGSAWLVGWVLTWFTKWVVSAAVFGPSTVLQDLSREMGFRLGSSLNGRLDLSFGAATRLNVSTWLHSGPVSRPVVIAGFGIAIALVIVALARHRLAGLIEVGLLLAPGLLPFVWFEVLRNHSEVHPLIDYRSLALTLGLAMAAGACVAFRRKAGAEALEADSRRYAQWL